MNEIPFETYQIGHARETDGRTITETRVHR